MLVLVSTKTQIRFGIDTCLSYHSVILDIFALGEWYSHPVALPYPKLNYPQDFWLNQHRYEFKLCKDGAYSLKVDELEIVSVANQSRKLY